MSTGTRSAAELVILVAKATEDYFDLVDPYVDPLPWLGVGGQIYGTRAGIRELLDELKEAQVAEARP